MTHLPGPDSLPLQARFTRPGRLPPQRELQGRVAVLDLAFQGGEPGRDIRWALSLGERLAVWIDHHDQPAWKELAADPRFVLVPRERAPACPPLITPERVARHGPADTLLAHGDLDGVLSAAKWMLLQAGLPVPGWVDPDSIAADTRQGVLTDRGDRLDRALRASPGRHRLRRAVVASVLAEARGLPEAAEVAEAVDRSARAHSAMRLTARHLADAALTLPDLKERVALVSLLDLPGDTRVDLTEVMLPLQRSHDLVLVLARERGGGLKVVASTDPGRSGLDLREEFGLEGFAPFRVHVSPAALLRRLPSEALRQTLETAGVAATTLPGADH